MLGAAASLAACGTPQAPGADGAMVRAERRAGTGPGTLDNLAARLLSAHNRERRARRETPLVWDAGLAASAADHGEELVRRGRLVGSDPDLRPRQGENLWMGARGTYSVEEMVSSWAAERRLFKPGFFPDVSASGHWQDIAHYTQLVWPGTSRVGCALHRSERWDFLVCRYAPTGNVVGHMLIESSGRV